MNHQMGAISEEIPRKKKKRNNARECFPTPKRGGGQTATLNQIIQIHLLQHRDICLHTVVILLLGLNRDHLHTAAISPTLHTKTFIQNSHPTRHRSACQELSDPCLLRISINDFIISSKISHPKKAHLSHEILEHSEDRDPLFLSNRKDQYSAPNCRIHLFSLAMDTSHSMTGK